MECVSSRTNRGAVGRGGGSHLDRGREARLLTCLQWHYTFAQMNFLQSLKKKQTPHKTQWTGNGCSSVPGDSRLERFCITEQTRPVLFFVCFCFCFVGSHLLAHGSSWASSGIGAVAAGLCHSHGNTRSEPHLQPMPQLVAMPDL